MNKNVFFKRVIDEIKNQQKIFEQLHDENEHKSRENIYRRVINRY